MISIDVLQLLLKTALASSAAMLVVLLLRGQVRRRLGATAAYLLWLAVPVVLLAMLLPAPRMPAMPMLATVGDGAVVGALPSPEVPLPWPSLLVLAWFVGALMMAVVLLRRQRRFVVGLGGLERRGDGLWQAQVVAGLPAAMGVLRPRIVLPAGFEQRYSEQEQRLVLLHEQVHLRRGDLLINAGWALLRCLYWFNPLLPLAMRRCREDQEFSCDERVIARSDGARRSYGNAMLKTGLALSPLPVGCHWQDHHPLKERMAMLKRPVPGKKQWLAMLVVSAVVSSGLGYAAWAAQPVETVASQGQMYAVSMTLDVEGESHRLQIHEQAGKPFAFSIKAKSGRAWNGEFTVAPLAGDQLRLSGSIAVDGEKLHAPSLVVHAGKAASVGVQSGAANSYQLTVDASPLLRPTPGQASGKQGGEADAAPIADAGAATSNRLPPPSYPEDAFEKGVSGNVLLRVEVGADGRVTDVTVTESQPQGVFDAAAVAAARQWTFTPARNKEGVPVASAVRVPVWFDLDEDVTHTDDVSGS